jgi:hypothetical protein
MFIMARTHPSMMNQKKKITHIYWIERFPVRSDDYLTVDVTGDEADLAG